MIKKIFFFEKLMEISDRTRQVEDVPRWRGSQRGTQNPRNTQSLAAFTNKVQRWARLHKQN